MSDRIAVLNQGRIEQIGSPDDLYDRPVNPFVASFLGSTVRVNGELVRPRHPHRPQPGDRAARW